MSKKQKNRARFTPELQQSEFKTTLRQLAEQRRGGSVNITGLEFQ